MIASLGSIIVIVIIHDRYLPDAAQTAIALASTAKPAKRQSIGGLDTAVSTLEPARAGEPRSRVHSSPDWAFVAAKMESGLNVCEAVHCARASPALWDERTSD
jgi:hypothetical protein